MNLGFLNKNAGLFMAIAAIFIIVDIIFVVFPQTNNIAETNAKLSAARDASTVLENNIAILQQLNSLKVRQSDDFARLSVAVPFKPAFEDAYVAIETMASRSGLQISSITPVKAGQQFAPVEITVKGAYQGILDFMSSVNRNLRPIEVENFGLVASKVNDQIELVGSFKLNFLYSPALRAKQ